MRSQDFFSLSYGALPYNAYSEGLGKPAHLAVCFCPEQCNKCGQWDLLLLFISKLEELRKKKKKKKKKKRPK